MEKKNKKEWWEKPGFSIMYQIEARPGWFWNRNYDKFNASMMDEKGNLNFNGPFCKMKKWVEFSKNVGVDYHVFEVKWHDGICYWDSKYTKWKTPEDYVKIFSEESEKVNIPFLYYYSSIFDHNPDFDDIQPLRGVTPSFIARHDENKENITKYSKIFAETIRDMFKDQVDERNIPYTNKFFDDVKIHDFTYNPKKYEDYVLNQIKELIQNYHPNGMWMDWFWGKDEATTILVMDFMEKNFPNTILTYNMSIDRHPKYIHYLSGEAHDVNTAWKSGKKYRRKKKPWELCGPAAYGWDVPQARPDPYEIFRIAAIIMANGGKYCFGLPSKMDGELYPEPAENVRIFGDWFKDRRDLFNEAIPMKYKGDKVPGIEIDEQQFGAIGSIYENDNLIHIINFKGLKKDISLKFSQEQWADIKEIALEPKKKNLVFMRKNNEIILSISKEDIDLADTIIRIMNKT